MEMGESKKARQGFLDAIEINRALGDTSGVIQILGNLAMLYHQNLHSPDQALNCYRQAQALCDKVDHPRRRAILLHREGRIYADLGRFEEAEEVFGKAIELLKKLSVESTLLQCLAERLYARQRAGCKDLSVEWKRLFEHSIRLNHSELRVRIQLFWSGHLFENGHHSQALKMLKDAEQDCQNLNVPMMVDATLIAAYFCARLGHADQACSLLEAHDQIGHEATINVIQGFVQLSKYSFLKAQQFAEQADRLSAHSLPYTGIRIKLRLLQKQLAEARAKSW